MRYNELFEAMRNWNQAKLDAESKGLHLELVSSGSKKYYRLSIPREIYDPLMKQNVLPHDIFTKLNKQPFIYVHRISEYPEASQKLEELLGIVKKLVDKNTRPDMLREQFFNWLQSAYETNNKKTQNLKQTLQLYVPRDSIHSSNPKHAIKPNNTWLYSYDDNGKRIQKEDIKGGLLPGKAVLRRGSNKPHGTAFWTSTAIKHPNNLWSSAWVDLAMNRYPTYYNNTGYIYSIKPSARILVIRDERDAYEIIKNYQLYEGKFVEPRQELEYREHIPWDLLPNHWDAVHVPNPSYAFGYEREIYWFSQDWDVESTVWFDTSVLQKEGVVNIIPMEFNNETD